MDNQFQKSNLIIVLLMLAFAACGLLVQYMQERAAGSKVLNIYCWDETFPALLAEYYPSYDPETQRIGAVQVNWFIAPEVGNGYQMELDKALSQQDSVEQTARIDLFLAEADYVRKYTGSDKYTLSLAELGIGEDDLREQFPYTLQAARDGDGILRGIAWQCTPGVMLYRRDMALEILGTDDPAAVHAATKDWQSFDELAGKVQEFGGTMLAGYEDTYRLFSSNRQHGWLQGEEITLDPALQQWVEQTRRFAEQKKLLPNRMWTSGWSEAVHGRTFCYFGPAWLINEAFMQLSLRTPVEQGGRLEKGNGTYGLWGVCEAPQPFFWGGSWLCAAKGTDNRELIADIMRTLCCSEATAWAMTSGQHLHFANNQQIMAKRAADPSISVPFLAGQNPYPVMLRTAYEMPDPTWQMTPYDQGMHHSFHSACIPYFQGQASWSLTWQRFLATVWSKHPELQDKSFVE